MLFMEKDGAPFDLHRHPPTTPAPSAMHDFAAAILADRPHPAPDEEGRIVMEILDAICASARTGGPVRL